MLKKLRVRFVLLSMAVLTCVLTVIVGTMNIMNYTSVVRNADRTLAFLAENGGKFPGIVDRPLHPMIGNSPELPYETRFFTVVINKDGATVTVDTTNIAAIREEEAAVMATSVMASGNKSGFNGSYRFIVSEDKGDTCVTFLDCGRSLSAANTFLILSLFASAVGLAVVMMLMILLSGRVVKPIADSYEKQRQFITNAGHDLKTPITVIDADTELAELELGRCEWLDDIRKQTRRLALLTGDLIYLSRMDEQPRLERTEIDFSAIILEEVDSFCAVAVSRGKEIVSKIAEDIRACGSETEIRKLVGLLIDNAIKYSTDSEIGVALERSGKHARLTVSNAAVGMSEESTSMMFDRFYRGDSSRASSGGFGIGLSIASAIVAAHKGRIWAALTDGMLTITVLLSIQ